MPSDVTLLREVAEQAFPTSNIPSPAAVNGQIGQDEEEVPWLGRA